MKKISVLLLTMVFLGREVLAPNASSYDDDSNSAIDISPYTAPMKNYYQSADNYLRSSVNPSQQEVQVKKEERIKGFSTDEWSEVELSN